MLVKAKSIKYRNMKSDNVGSNGTNVEESVNQK